MLIYEFNKKYAKNSNISSVLSCLYSYQEFTELFLNNQQYINDNSNTKPISFTYLFGINAINDQVNEDWNNSCVVLEAYYLKRTYYMKEIKK